MESLRQQPPARADAESHKAQIPDVDLSAAYKRKPLRHRIEYGVRVQMGSAAEQELARILGAKKLQMMRANSMSCCVVCDEPCVDGEFAVETVLFIPNKGDPAYEHLGRFRIELPRIACRECAAEHADIDHAKASPSPNAQPPLTLGAVWKNYQSGQPFPFDGKGATKTSSDDAKAASPREIPVQPRSRPQPPPQPQQQQQAHGRPHYVPPHDRTSYQSHGYGQAHHAQGGHGGYRGTQGTYAQHTQQSHHTQHTQQQSQKVNLPLSGHGPEAERDAFDDGFLICTQLVKTGGADQGGLQVGDVFVEFGPYFKKKFPGLKSIANLVRRSAAKDINVVVWRKQEIKAGDGREAREVFDDDGTGRTVFQKLALKLKPLQSHDADGGGVLGAVINTYPLPEMRN